MCHCHTGPRRANRSQSEWKPPGLGVQRLSGALSTPSNENQSQRVSIPPRAVQMPPCLEPCFRDAHAKSQWPITHHTCRRLKTMSTDSSFLFTKLLARRFSGPPSLSVCCNRHHLDKIRYLLTSCQNSRLSRRP